MFPFDIALERLEFEMRSQRRSPRTTQEYHWILHRLDRELGGISCPPRQAKERIERWRSRSLARFERGEIKASKFRNEHSALRAFYDVMGYDPNPAREFKMLPRDEWIPRPVPFADVERLMAACEPVVDGRLDPVRLRDRAILELFYNGLRNHEVCGLRLEDVAYSAEEQTLVLHVLGKGNRRSPGGKWRFVPLAPLSAEILAVYLLERHAPADWRGWLEDFKDQPLALLLATDRLLGKRLRGDKGRVFTMTRTLGLAKPREGRLTVRAGDRIYAKYREEAGLPVHYTPHAFRHSCATFLLEQNVDIRKISELLGHSTIMVTQLYTKVTVRTAAAAMRHLPASGKRVLHGMAHVAGSELGDVVSGAEPASAPASAAAHQPDGDPARDLSAVA